MSITWSEKSKYGVYRAETKAGSLLVQWTSTGWRVSVFGNITKKLWSDEASAKIAAEIGARAILKASLLQLEKE